MAVVNAQFSTGLSLSVQQSVFATQQVFTGDVTSLVNFADLLGVALTTRVASEKFAEFTAAIQLVYDGLSEVTALGTPVVEVVAQEEYLTPAGQFVYNLLYVVKINNQPLGPISLPRTPTLPELASLAMIKDLNDVYYVLSSVSNQMLYRFKNAVSFFTPSWLARSQQATLLTSLQTAARMSLSDVTGTITVTYGAQEFYYDSSDMSRPVRLSYFIMVDGSIINGALEQQVSTADLGIEVIDMPSTARNLRYAFHVDVAGLITQAQAEMFVPQLQTAWTAVQAGLTVELALTVEAIGTRGYIHASITLRSSLKPLYRNILYMQNDKTTFTMRSSTMYVCVISGYNVLL